MKKTVSSFDLGIDHLLPSESEERKQKKNNNNSALYASLLVLKLGDFVEGAQAKTTKYATKYAVKVFESIFCI